MKTTPILMTGGNVVAIQEDRKTNTRRVLAGVGGRLQFHACLTGDCAHDTSEECHKKLLEESPYGQVGDRLALKETFWCYGRWNMGVSAETGKVTAEWINLTDAAHPIIYDADKPGLSKIERHLVGYHKRPSIYLPMYAWRIHLEITRIAVERLQDISEEDAIAEGIIEDLDCIVGAHCGGGRHTEIKGTLYFWSGSDDGYETAAEAYRELWDSINGNPSPGKPDVSWDANPWVWSIHFNKLS